MKCWAWLIVLTATAAPGCVILPAKVEEPQKIEEPQRPPPERKGLQTSRPITPEEVNESNVQESFQRLSAEVQANQDAAPRGPR